MELNLLSDIMIFNQRVTQHIGGLEQSVRDEIRSLQVEQQKEEVRRVNADRFLTTQVQDFLRNLQNPQLGSPAQLQAIQASQMRHLITNGGEDEEEPGGVDI